MVWVGVGRGERAGGDHGEDGGWGVGLRIRGQNKVSRNWVRVWIQAYN